MKLRAAVIGTGFVGPHHVDGIRRAGYADVVALAGTDQTRVEARAAALGIPRATTDVAALLDDQDIDVIHICTPNATHAELAQRALVRGHHVVVEKPMTLTSADADALIATADRVGRHAAVAFTYRGYPMVRRARAMVRSTDIGEVRLAHGAYLQDWLAQPTDYNWRLEPAAGGPARAVADIGTHWFDTIEFVTGRRIEAVFADLMTFMKTRQRARGGCHGLPDRNRPERRGGHRNRGRRLDRGSFRRRRRRHAACQPGQRRPQERVQLGEVAGSTGTLAWAQESPETLWLGRRDPNETRLLTRAPEQEDWPGTPSTPAGHPQGWADAWRDLFRPFYRQIAE